MLGSMPNLFLIRVFLFHDSQSNVYFIEVDKIIDKLQSTKKGIYCSDGELNIGIISKNHFSPAMFPLSYWWINVSIFRKLFRFFDDG